MTFFAPLVSSFPTTHTVGTRSQYSNGRTWANVLNGTHKEAHTFQYYDRVLTYPHWYTHRRTRRIFSRFLEHLITLTNGTKFFPLDLLASVKHRNLLPIFMGEVLKLGFYCSSSWWGSPISFSGCGIWLILRPGSGIWEWKGGVIRDWNCKRDTGIGNSTGRDSGIDKCTEIQESRWQKFTKRIKLWNF